MSAMKMSTKDDEWVFFLRKEVPLKKFDVVDYNSRFGRKKLLECQLSL